MAKLDQETLQNELKKKRICRFCLSQDEALLTNIFLRDTRIKSAAPLPIQVIAIASIEVYNNDGMPSYVCSDCISIFEYSYQFKQMCKKADNLLRQYPFVGKWPSCLKKPVMSQTLPTMPISKHNTRTTHKKDPLSLPKKILNANVKEPTTSKKTFIKEFVPEVDKVDDEFSITYLEKNDNNDKLSLDGIQLLVASEDVAEAESINIENLPVIDINCGSKTTKPKLLNKSSVRILNKEAVPENEPRLTPKPKINKSQGNMEIVAEISNVDDKYGKEPDPTNAEPAETNIFPCPKCDRAFPLAQLRDLHIKRHFRVRNFQCDKCSKSFFSKYHLQSHLDIHKRPYACSACGKTFSRSILLTRHEKTHTDIPKYICVHCEMSFISNEDMQRHAKRHNINRPFKCNLCNKGFTFKHILERHEATHSRQQKFSCQYCDKSFSTPTHLARHLKAHAGLRPYPCRFCKKSYLLSHHLTLHLRSHKNIYENADADFMCSTCKTSFKSHDELIQHSKTHADDQNLDCPLCKEIFDDMKAVTAHIQDHSEGEAYACEFCDLIFITAEKLQMHTDLEHAQEMEAYHEDDRAQANKMNTETMKIEIEDERLQYTVNEMPPDEHLDDGAQANKNRETLKDDIEDEKLQNNVNEFLLDENSDDGNDSNNSLKTISKNDQESSPKMIHQIVIQSKNGPMNSVEYETKIAENENLLIPLKQCKIVASEKDVTTAVSSKPSTQLKRKIANTATPTRDANQPTIQSLLKMPKSNTEIKSEASSPENKPCVIKVESDASTSLSSSTGKVTENQNLVKGGKKKKVQKIRVTKAEATAMAKDGRIKVKDGKLILNNN